jgi:hypothetical protein
MKKLQLLSIVAVWLLMSCKKDMIPSIAPTPVSSHKISELKSWFESHKKTGGSQHRDEFTLPDQVPVWDSTIYHPDGSVFTTPLEKDGQADPNVTRSLVLEVDANGNVISGEYTFIRLTNAPGNLTPAQVLESYPKVFEFTDMPDNFKASMLKYNLNGEIIYAKHFDNQVITDTDEKIKSTERAPVAVPDEGIEICIDSWWVTYYSDGTYTIEYLWSECFIIGGTTGGGNGGGPTASMCEQELETFADEGQAVNGDMQPTLESTTSPSPNVTIANFHVKWKIYDAVTWYITSYESATLEKVYNVTNNSITKQFISFQHLNVAESGMSIGGARTFSLISAPIINFGSLVTTEVIHFKVIHTTLCIPNTNLPIPPATRNHTSTGIFVASQFIF